MQYPTLPIHLSKLSITSWMHLQTCQMKCIFNHKTVTLRRNNTECTKFCILAGFDSAKVVFNTSLKWMDTSFWLDCWIVSWPKENLWYDKSDLPQLGMKSFCSLHVLLLPPTQKWWRFMFISLSVHPSIYPSSKPDILSSNLTSWCFFEFSMERQC